jgi:hypothetical protein
MEKIGIPTTIITKRGFTGIVSTTFAGLGFPAEAPITYEFPVDLFNAGSNLTPINQNIDKLANGLTKWQPKMAIKGLLKPDMESVQGKDFQEALNNVAVLFARNQWTDGLPVVPPTEEKVKWILTGTDLPRDTVVAKSIPPLGRVATVESVAVSLAMAGGRPEYLPVLLAAVDAVNDPAFGFSTVNGGAGSTVPAVIINGPIAKEIRLGTGYQLLGTDPTHPAGASIGRALRLLQQNVGGAIPGVGSMAMFGGFRATNAVFAEDEEGLPKGWSSLAVERGFAKDANVVTVSPVNSMVNVTWYLGSRATNERAMMTLSKAMSIPNLSAWSGISGTVTADPNRAAGIALLPRAAANAFATNSSLSKLDVKKFLWENSKLPWDQVSAMGIDASLASQGFDIPDGEDLPLTAKPEQLTIVVAGGDRSGNGYWMAPGESGHLMVSKAIKLPAKWQDLVDQSIPDLGPMPSTR